MKKGFAQLFLVLIFIVVLIFSIGAFAFYKTTLKEPGNSAPTQSRRVFENQVSDDTGSKNDLLMGLRKEMAKYSNYAMEVEAVGKPSISYKVFRNGQKAKRISGNGLLVAFQDNSKGKSYTYDDKSISYGEDSLSALEWSQSSPEYFISKMGPDTHEVSSSQNSKVFQSKNSEAVTNVEINRDGLPVKQTVESGQTIWELNISFTGINEVTESDVTLPSDAKKVVDF